MRRLHLESGDIAVWGAPTRFVYHGGSDDRLHFAVGVVDRGRARRAHRRGQPIQIKTQKREDVTCRITGQEESSL
jgi:hypothetical protein